MTTRRRFPMPWTCAVLTLLLAVAVPAPAALRYAEPSAPSSLNPFLVRDMPSLRAVELVYEGLVTPPDAGRVRPLLAESWLVSDDGREVTFRLRRDVTWHDGEPFTARDVAFTVAAGRDPRSATPLRAQFAVFAAVDVLGDHAVRFRFVRKPVNPLLYFDFKILPAHVFPEGFVPADAGSRRVVGTGPFAFEAWTAGGELRLVRNPRYHRPGEPGVAAVEVSPVPDPNIRNELLRYGALDLLPQVRPRDIPALEELGGVRLYPYSTLSYSFLGFNFRTPALRDRRVRRALVHGLDRTAMLRAHYGGRGTVISGPFPSASWAYNFDVKPWEHDPARAAALLDEAGWRDRDGDGRRESEAGVPLLLRLVSTARDEAQKAVVLDVEQQLRNLGVTVEVRFLEPLAWREAVFDDHAFDLVLAEWTFDHNVDVYTLFHSTQTGPGQNNLGGYADPETDRLLDESRVVPDSEALRAVYGELHRLLHEDLPYAFLWSLDRYAAVSTRIERVRLHPFYFFSYVGAWQER